MGPLWSSLPQKDLWGHFQWKSISILSSSPQSLVDFLEIDKLVDTPLHKCGGGQQQQ